MKGYLELPLVPSLLAFTLGNTHLIIFPKSGALNVRAAFMLSQCALKSVLSILMTHLNNCNFDKKMKVKVKYHCNHSNYHEHFK